MFQAYHVFKLHHVTYKSAKFFYATFHSNSWKKKHEGSTHFYIYAISSIVSIRSFINQSRFPRHSIPISFIHPSILHSIQYHEKREKILKFASYFCYSTFLQRQEKETLSFRFNEKLVIKKKRKRNRNDSRVGGDVLSKAWHLVVERQNKIKRASERKREGSKITK